MRGMGPKRGVGTNGTRPGLLRAIGSKLSSLSARSALVRQAQIDQLLRYTRFQSIGAPCLGFFMVAAFPDSEFRATAWIWIAVLLGTYGARAVAFMFVSRFGVGIAERRLKIYIYGMGAAGLVWSLAPHAIGPPGSNAQLLAGIFVILAVLVGVLGNFLYLQSALVFVATWIVPMLVSVWFVFAASFPGFEWTYVAVIIVFLLYAYRCLEIINLPLGEVLELNEELFTEKNRAEASERAKNDFLAMMSHELRTPLNAIMGFSEMIRDETYGPHANKKYVEQASFIREAGGLLSDLISDLLELSALEARDRDLINEEIEVKRLVNTSIQLLQDSAAERQIDVRARVHEDLPVLQVDRRSALQCLMNILGNAIKFSPDGAHIDVDARVSGDFVQIQVVDQGAGIPEAELGYVTEPFRRGSTTREAVNQGVGLGLAIAENLMNRLKGSLEVDSSSSRGTTVTLSFPIATKTEANEPA
jgi:signal transduction histidine kinase